MINFFKKKKIVEFEDNAFIAVGDGKLVDLNKVPDELFSKKLMGDGFAIELEGDIIVAPANGMINTVFHTGHAFGMTLNNGVEVLVHIGLDTVSLNGDGFKILVRDSVKVKAGTPIVQIDRKYIEGKGLKTITMVVVTNNYNYKLYINELENVKSGKDIVALLK